MPGAMVCRLALSNRPPGLMTAWVWPLSSALTVEQGCLQQALVYAELCCVAQAHVERAQKELAAQQEHTMMQPAPRLQSAGSAAATMGSDCAQLAM